VPESLAYKADTKLPDRLNQDVNTNERGLKLLDMCVSTGLRILNGRKPGDTMGYLTCHKYNGSSMVDYGIVSEALFNDILYFHVHNNFTHISDHCQISLCIHILQIAQYSLPKLKMEPIARGFTWDSNSPLLFQKALCNLAPTINLFCDSVFEESDSGVERALVDFNDIVINAANSSLKRSKSSSGKAKKKRNKKWFGPNLHKLKTDVLKCGRLLCNSPYDPVTRGIYYKTLKLYKKQCKIECKRFKSNIISALENLEDTNPNEYWRLV
jgi:hypothetical protein